MQKYKRIEKKSQKICIVFKLLVVYNKTAKCEMHLGGIKNDCSR